MMITFRYKDDTTNGQWQTLTVQEDSVEDLIEDFGLMNEEVTDYEILTIK